MHHGRFLSADIIRKESNPVRTEGITFCEQWRGLLTMDLTLSCAGWAVDMSMELLKRIYDSSSLLLSPRIARLHTYMQLSCQIRARGILKEKNE